MSYCYSCGNESESLQHGLCSVCINYFNWCVSDWSAAVAEAVAGVAPSTSTALKERVAGSRSQPSLVDADACKQLASSLDWFYGLCLQFAESGSEQAVLADAGRRDHGVLNGAGARHSDRAETLAAWAGTAVQATTDMAFAGIVVEFREHLQTLHKLAPKPGVRIIKQRARQCPVCFEQAVRVRFVAGEPVVRCEGCSYLLEVDYVDLGLPGGGSVCEGDADNG